MEEQLEGRHPEAEDRGCSRAVYLPQIARLSSSGMEVITKATIREHSKLGKNNSECEHKGIEMATE